MTKSKKVCSKGDVDWVEVKNTDKKESRNSLKDQIRIVQCPPWRELRSYRVARGGLMADVDIMTVETPRFPAEARQQGPM